MEKTKLLSELPSLSFLCIFRTCSEFRGRGYISLLALQPSIKGKQYGLEKQSCLEYTHTELQVSNCSLPAPKYLISSLQSTVGTAIQLAGPRREGGGGSPGSTIFGDNMIIGRTLNRVSLLFFHRSSRMIKISATCSARFAFIFQS